MLVDHHGTKITTEQATDMMLAEKYRVQEDGVREVAIKNTKKKGLVLELFAGMGNCTNLYKQKKFRKIITNDVNKKSLAQYKMEAMKFIKEILPTLTEKIDLVDFDCYGCHSFEFQEFFRVRKDKDLPLVVCYIDGFGLYMKRFLKRNEEGKEMIRQRYLVKGDFNLIKIWDRHQYLVDTLMKKTADIHKMKVKKLIGIQTKGKSYIISSYLFYK
jgi:hypothetical protein